jgi:ubiquinone/menaquinone biosynthesis C-methylase UbiE
MKIQAVKKQYNNLHTLYSKQVLHLNEIANTLFHSHLLALNLKASRVLDVGCGDGTDLQKILKQGALVYGIDPSEEFIKVAQKNNPNGHFEVGTGEALPYTDKLFDFVISKYALQTSSSVQKIFKEVARVTRPGGLILMVIKHPLQQYLEKIRDHGNGANYYEQKIVTSNIFGGSIILKEPSHTMTDYFNESFFKSFELLDYQEASDFPASEQMNGGIYPTFFIIKARRK